MPLVLLLSLLVCQSLVSGNEEPALHSDNVCIDQIIETSITNITFHQTMEIQDYSWCLRIPPRCMSYKQKVVERVRPENVTRVVNKRLCCPGYAIQSDGLCIPVCSTPCLKGVCVGPDICQCEPGFSGVHCHIPGCPKGNWGPDCSKPCACRNGGTCDAQTGACDCLAGWQGVDCQSPCQPGTFGQRCEQKCACAASGERCYPVTGDCLQCSAGTYGPNCGSQCSCNKAGTAVCYHLDGKCFCQPNWYGPECELHCPFGYVDGVCHTSRISNASICSCPTEYYVCEEDRGCVCKDSHMCQGGQLIALLSPWTDDQKEISGNSQLTAIIVSVVVIALIVAMAVIWYYRRRMKVLQKDLQNRSVYYVENSILDPGRHHRTADLVIKQSDLCEAPVDAGTMDSDHVVTTANTANNLLMSTKFDKNVNIDHFKLGTTAADQMCSTTSGGASAACCRPEDAAEAAVCDQAAGLDLFRDVNLYDDDCSPSKAKNNHILENQRKINKANLYSVLNNITTTDQEDAASDAGRRPK